jgi:hypothetical protein
MYVEKVLNQFRRNVESFKILKNPQGIFSDEALKGYDFMLYQMEHWILIAEGDNMKFSEYCYLQESPLAYTFTPTKQNEVNNELAKYDYNENHIIDLMHVYNILIHVQKEVTNDMEELLFINRDTKELIVRYKYQTIPPSVRYPIIEKLIWQSINYKTFAENIYMNYILKQFNYIISDEGMTNLGQDFFKKIYKILIAKNTHQIGLINIKNNQIIKKFHYIDDIDTNWDQSFQDDELNAIDKRFYILKK